MAILNLKAIATATTLTGLSLLTGLNPAQAGEINVTCNTALGNTTIALNGKDSIPFKNWSLADAVDIAYAVKQQCQKSGESSVPTVSRSEYGRQADGTPQSLQRQADLSPTVSVVNPTVPGLLW